MRKIVVPEDRTGWRLDKFLSVELTGFGRNNIKKLINSGQVIVAGKIRKSAYKIRPAEEIIISEPECPPSPEQGRAFSLPIDILYEDKDILVVDKPKDLVVHAPSPGYKATLVNALLAMGKRLSDVDPSRKGIVHRLDKETTGVLLIAKNNHAHEEIVRQFKSRTVKKEYRAIVWGVFNPGTISLNLPLRRDENHRLRMKVGFSAAKRAETKIKAVRTWNDCSYLSLTPLTGRMHQLRVHLKFLGYPIIGDRKYGIKDKYKDLFLHAYKIGFRHPCTGEFMEFKTELPKRFIEFMESRET